MGLFKKKNEIKNNENTEENKSVIFVNKPITDDKEDLIGIESYIKRVEKAIDEGSNVIGIVGDYGIGKSSLIRLIKNKYKKETTILSKVKKKKIKLKNKVIPVNLWGKDNLKNEELTSEFLFQISNGCNKNFASYIAKKVGKNYGIIGLDTPEKNLLKKILLPSILIVIYFILNMFPLDFYESSIYTNFNQMVTFTKEWIWIKNTIITLYTLAVSLKYMILAIAIWKIIKLFFNKTIIFSWLNSQGKINRTNIDFYELYLEIAEKLIEEVPEDGKCIIVIDDLDRTDDKKIVIDFIKEVYKFINILKEEQRNKFVFIIEVKDESALEVENNNIEGIYKKIFAFKVNLNGIYFRDYERVLLKILKDNKYIQELLGIKIEDALPNDFSYIIKGECLTIRDIKERLNRSCEIYENLYAKNNANDGKINFKKCTIVAYLESKYPKAMLGLYSEENNFGNVLDKSYKYKQDENLTREEKETEIKKTVEDLFKNQKDIKNISKEFAELILAGLIDDDFRLYFYNYPKDERIKSENEYYVQQLLLYPDGHTIVNDEKIQNALEKDPNIIANCLQRRYSQELSFTTIIFENEIIYKIALEKFYLKVLQVLDKDVLWRREDLEKSGEILNKISKYNIDSSKLLTEYSKEIENKIKIFSREDIIEARYSIITNVDKKYLNCFKNLYLASNMPIISEKELKYIKDNNQKIKFINSSLITSKEVEYLLNELNISGCDETYYMNVIEIIKIIQSKKIDNNIIKSIIFDFLMKNNKIDEDVFNVLTLSILQKNFILEESLIVKYLENLDDENFSEKLLKNIDDLMIVNKLSDRILNKLLDNNLFKTYWVNLIYQNRCNELNLKENIVDNLMLIKKIYSRISNVFINLRCEIINQQLEIEYKEIFFNPYEKITIKEVDLFLNLNNLIECINFEELEENNITAIVKKINILLNTKDELLNIIYVCDKRKKNSIKDISLIQSFWTNIDVSKIDFSTFSDTELKQIYDILYQPLMLNDYDNALEFSSKIKYIIKDIDMRFYSMIGSRNNVLIEKYIELINLINNPTEQTIKNVILIINYGMEYRLSENILEQLLLKQYIQAYIIGSVLQLENKKFQKNEIIDLKEYINEYNKCKKVYEILKENNEFKELVIFEEKLNLIDKKLLKDFYTLDFSEELLKYIFENLTKEEIKIYVKNNLKISNALDSFRARNFFVEEKNKWILEDYDVYISIWEKLDAGDKGQLTKARNSIIKKNKTEL